MRNREVARIYPGADFGDQFEIVNVELADPAVARSEVHEAPVTRVLGPAMQRETRLEAVDRFESIAVEQRYMVVAEFDHEKEIEHIRDLEYRSIG